MPRRTMIISNPRVLGFDVNSLTVVVIGAPISLLAVLNLDLY